MIKLECLLYLLFVVLSTSSCQAARIWLPQNLVGQIYQRQTLDDGLRVGLRRRLEPSLAYRQEDWPSKLYNSSLVLTKRFGRPAEVLPQISYVISPLSEQIIPISSEKLSQGYRDFFPLTDTYKLGLQKVSPPFGENELQLDADQQLQQSILGGGCRTLISTVELERDEIDKASGRVVRTCRGLVQLNRCEGSCPSSVQPSIKSRSGFKKNCSCCNEAAFRRVQVRLSDCTLAQAPANNQQVLVLADNTQSSNHENLPNLMLRDLAQEFKASGQLDSMDIEIEEPIECKCRNCDNSL